MIDWLRAGFHTNFFPEVMFPLWVPLFGQYVLPEADLQKMGLPITNLGKRSAPL
jgi:hypothetical protein